MPSHQYAPSKDRTLRAGQHAGFRLGAIQKVRNRQTIKSEEFRVPSNKTKYGWSTGYHEAFGVTNHVKLLALRAPAVQGRSRVPTGTSKFFKTYGAHKITEANVKAFLETADAARTDTARTILTAPGREPAGHTGSNISTSGQSAAHNLLRWQAIRVLTDDDKNMTGKAMAVIATATVVTSMAPGEVARKIHNVGNLKANSALSTWEEDRNESKRRVHAMYAALSSAERAVVDKHMNNFLSTLQDPQRRLANQRATTPLRETSKGPGAVVQGGGYLALMTVQGAPSVEPPDPATGLFAAVAYGTERGRVERS